MSAPPESSPKVTEKRAAELREIADSLGLSITIRCRYCKAPLWDQKSVAAHAGPVCRRKHENDPGATPAKKSRTEAAATIPTT